MITSIIIGKNKEEIKVICRDNNGNIKTYILSSLDKRKGVSAVISEIERMEKILNDTLLEKVDSSDKIRHLKAEKHKNIREEILSKIKEGKNKKIESENSESEVLVKTKKNKKQKD